MTGEAVPYAELLAANIRAERARARLSQQVLAARMRRLGFDHWLHQTAGASERGERRVTAEEILGLCLALGVTMPDLMGAAGTDHLVTLPSGDGIGSATLRQLARGASARVLAWDGDEAGWPAG